LDSQFWEMGIGEYAALKHSHLEEWKFLDRLNVISTCFVAGGLGAKIDPAKVFIVPENAKDYKKASSAGQRPDAEQSRRIWGQFVMMAKAHNKANEERERRKAARRREKEGRELASAEVKASHG